MLHDKAGKEPIVNSEMIFVLNDLSKVINEHYGYVAQVGSNFGEPVINSGPCGPFANVFYDAWNKRFPEKVTICFVMEISNNECHHVLIRLPNGMLFDGGNGVHDESFYDERYKIEEMKIYNYQLLDERSYGLNRTYPRFCPNFNIEELKQIISTYLDKMANND